MKEKNFLKTFTDIMTSTTINVVFLFVVIVNISDLFLNNKKFQVRCQQIGHRGKIGKEQLCNQSWFMDNYFIPNNYINLELLKNTCNETHYKDCSSVLSRPPSSSMREDRIKRTSYYEISVQVPNLKNQKCWGYGIEIVSKQGKQTRFFNITSTVNSVSFAFGLKINYTIRFLAIPSGKVYENSWSSPGRCELEIINDIYNRMLREGKGCEKRTDYNGHSSFAETQCALNEDPDVRREKLKNKLSIDENCTIKLNLDASESYTDKITITLSISALVLLLIIVIVIYLSKRKSRRDFLKPAEDVIPFHTTDASQNTVIILHRPGCEHLNNLVHELRNLLSSYGIHVKNTLVDQAILDAEGGVASFMQRNIRSCDYVLILLTEKGVDKIARHRAYEFAIKLLEGLAVHDNKLSSYIPIYLQSYYEVVHLFPSFLQASTSYGYRLPNDAYRLLHRILKTTSLERGKERESKDRIFFNNIKVSLKQYAKKQHLNCCKDRCANGMHYPSVDNLSSYWASTVHGKCPSIESLVEIKSALHAISDQDLFIGTSTEEDSYEKTSKYLSDITNRCASTNSDNDSHDVFLDSQDDDGTTTTTSFYPERVELLPSTCSAVSSAHTGTTHVTMCDEYNHIHSGSTCTDREEEEEEKEEQRKETDIC